MSPLTQTKPNTKPTAVAVQRIPLVFRAPCIYCAGILDIRFQHTVYISGARAHNSCVEEHAAEEWRKAQKPMFSE